VPARGLARREAPADDAYTIVVDETGGDRRRTAHAADSTLPP